ncbi:MULTISPECIES: arylamine N-acetyltransferase [unclassified Mesorhizobium]|uniref:arylamine N-acetyltransferase family protein n=1 Tax=unclassified Mesorhizobium TaxID=325217 RepID=UPI00086E3F98|nr:MULTISPECIES: arylamine N-acetyltransferase [unclassified Mesorhizobium]MBN9258360.1 arylamine N-acetyltransferase [Mesorhizobium sp.]ODT12791.1 MAG: arylamine N-acetyltransferase [Mesorhizobium sp. SCN 65-12]OJX73665.1 MAG: arylamine N-acetyltransferase [Mesorhizobium sp. 65-26]
MTQVSSSESGMTLTSGQLDAYLARIGIDRPVSLDAESLSRLHRAHLMAFTWEALDAFMGWPSSVAPTAAFAKMVEGRRGGWCYEMNGLLGAALAALGFRVTRLCGGVDRAKMGDLAIGNHLTLRIDLDRPYLAEVGLADAIVEPVPLEVGPISQRGFDFSIMPADGGWLRFHNHAHGLAPSFDFRPDHSDEAAIAATFGWLTQDPGSPFTNALAILRHTADGYTALQNDCLRRVTAAGISEQRITSADHLADTLETTFDIDVPQSGRAWEKIQAVGRGKAA